jgi:hypothetical protein
MTSTEKISTILGILRLHYCDSAMLPRPATEKDIADCNKDLAELAMPALPADYAELLRQCNGMAWNGVELYGTDRVTDNSDGFVLIDIVSNSDAQDDYFAERIDVYEALYIGRSDEEFFIYNAENKKYEIYDRSGMDVVGTFDTVGDMLFDDTVGARLGLNQRSEANAEADADTAVESDDEDDDEVEESYDEGPYHGES